MGTEFSRRAFLKGAAIAGASAAAIGALAGCSSGAAAGAEGDEVAVRVLFADTGSGLNGAQIILADLPFAGGEIRGTVGLEADLGFLRNQLIASYDFQNVSTFFRMLIMI